MIANETTIWPSPYNVDVTVEWQKSMPYSPLYKNVKYFKWENLNIAIKIV